ncbi:MAG: hypothetical protein ACLFRB_03170 [Thiohalorhabdus sp.]|uniref:hypothetical protein n=1 Tax=Thiohalorhabdus sp. TaxID=3094134 RepID=UPI003980C1E7
MALLDLAEAEGRALRRGLVRLGGGLALAILAALLAAAAVGLLLWALYLFTAALLDPVAGALVTGLAALAAAGALGWLASRLGR